MRTDADTLKINFCYSRNPIILSTFSIPEAPSKVVLESVAKKDTGLNSLCLLNFYKDEAGSPHLYSVYFCNA